MNTGSAPPLLDVRDLRVWFSRREGFLGRRVSHARAVDGVTLELHPGETLGLVGESGSGKSTVARAVLRLVPVTGGRVRFEGRDLLTLRGAELRAVRRRAQMVFQDPAGSLNPRMRVGAMIAEPIIVHRLAASRREARMQVGELLESCGMPASAADRYPHEFSGGQRQRIAIARALAVRPRLIVCDEPTSALDVSVQAQILNLLTDLRDRHGLSYLFISHDMGVIRHIADRVAVMKDGRIVEQGGRDKVLDAPAHPYTRALLGAVPGTDPHRRKA